MHRPTDRPLPPLSLPLFLFQLLYTIHRAPFLCVSLSLFLSFIPTISCHTIQSRCTINEIIIEYAYRELQHLEHHEPFHFCGPSLIPGDFNAALFARNARHPFLEKRERKRYRATRNFHSFFFLSIFAFPSYTACSRCIANE